MGRVHRNVVDILCGIPYLYSCLSEESFDSITFWNHSMDAGIVVQSSEVEIHNSIGIGERCSATLRSVYLTIRKEHRRK